MQAEEKKPVRLRPLTRRETQAIIATFPHLPITALIDLSSLYALDISGGAYVDVFEIPPATYNLVIQTILNLGRSPYAGGLYVGLIDRRTLRFKPSLPLAFRACRLCNLAPEYCYILGSREASRFTYGRRIVLRRAPRAAGELLPVASREGECLGWGRLCRHDTIKYLCPQTDVGWYLRRGG